MVSLGIYRHYKGQEYVVLGVARHSETEKEFVVYRAMYDDQRLWIRPVSVLLRASIKEAYLFRVFHE